MKVTDSDDGQGLPEDFDPARSTGVGMRVITALAGQIRAKFDVLPREQGAGFTIWVPVEV